MKIIFNLETPEGRKEFKEILGFVDADFNFKNMKSDLLDAVTELIKVIGKESYEYAYDLWDNKAEGDDGKLLVRRVQSPIAYQAFRKYAPKSDLSSTNQGRQVRLEDHHKMGWDWMYDRHDENLERDYYKQLDYLIELLDAQNPTISEGVKWTDTEAFKNSHNILFRTAAEFDEYFTIESRFLLMKLAPGIRKVLKEDVEPRVPSSILDEIFDALKSNAEEIPHGPLLREIRNATAYLSLSWAIPRMSATLFPNGVLQTYVSDRKTTISKKVPEKSEVGVMSMLFHDDGMKALKRIEKLIADKNTSTNSDQKINLFDENIRSTDKFISTC